MSASFAPATPLRLCRRLTLLLALVLVRPAWAGPAASGSGPWDLAQLRKPPAVLERSAGKQPEEIYYQGEPFQGKPTRVFAYLAYPEKRQERMPAMVLVHGGGGTAFREWADLWAKRGYVALAMDLAGQGPDRKRLPDGGPGQDHKAKFEVEKVRDLWSYHAVANVIRAVSLVRSLPGVDPERVGITGISWGGYLTCIVAGLDDRLAVAVPVYGCGFLHENSAWLDILEGMTPERRKLWVDSFDPSRYLGQARMPVLFVNGTNDFAYPLDSYQKSYRLVRSRTLCVTVNMPHGHPAGWAPVEISLFVDQHLRGGTPLPAITSVESAGDTIEAGYRSPVPLRKAALHFTTDQGPWKERKWQTLPATIKDGVVKATLPKDARAVWFLTITDTRGATVSSEHRTLEQ